MTTETTINTLRLMRGSNDLQWYGGGTESASTSSVGKVWVGLSVKDVGDFLRGERENAAIDLIVDHGDVGLYFEANLGSDPIGDAGLDHNHPSRTIDPRRLREGASGHHIVPAFSAWFDSECLGRREGYLLKETSYIDQVGFQLAMGSDSSISVAANKSMSGEFLLRQSYGEGLSFRDLESIQTALVRHLSGTWTSAELVAREGQSGMPKVAETRYEEDSGEASAAPEPLLAEALADLKQVVEEAQEEGFNIPSLPAIRNAERLLRSLYQIAPRRFEVYPVQDGDIALDGRGTPRRWFVLYCSSDGGALCTAGIDGRRYFQRYPNADILPDPYVRSALDALDNHQRHDLS